MHLKIFWLFLFAKDFCVNMCLVILEAKIWYFNVSTFQYFIEQFTVTFWLFQEPRYLYG